MEQATSRRYIKITIFISVLLVLLVCFVIALKMSLKLPGILDAFQITGGIILLPGILTQLIVIIRKRYTGTLSIVNCITMFLGIGLMEIYAVQQYINGIDVFAFLITNSICFSLKIVEMLLFIIFPENLENVV